jgi:ketosteroid isomerase-like protein
MSTSHPNADLLKKLYADFSAGNMQSVLDACSDEIKFSVPGKSPLAGTYTKADFASKLIAHAKELSGGTFQLVAHDILANDQHACVLVSHTVTRKGAKSEYRLCHIWRFTQGKPVAWYEYPRDLYQFDAVWS